MVTGLILPLNIYFTVSFTQSGLFDRSLCPTFLIRFISSDFRIFAQWLFRKKEKKEKKNFFATT